jgi:L-ribulose-5-phosphate 3-epimerase
MPQLDVAASTFPFLYSHDGLGALKHLRGLGYDKFEMMIFPPHCWPRELSPRQRKEYRDWLDGEGGAITSFCYPLLDNNPNGVDRLMRAYTLDRYKEAIDLAAEWNCPYVVAIPGPVNSLINPPTSGCSTGSWRAMKELVAYAKGTGVEHPAGKRPLHLPAHRQGHGRDRRLIGPEVGVNFDVCNSAFIKEDPAEAIRMLGTSSRTSTSPIRAMASSSTSASAPGSWSRGRRRRRWPTSAIPARRCSRSSPTRWPKAPTRTPTSWPATRSLPSTAGSRSASPAPPRPEDHPGHAGRGVGGEEMRDVRHLLGRGEAAQRRFLCQRGQRRIGRRAARPWRGRPGPSAPRSRSAPAPARSPACPAARVQRRRAHDPDDRVLRRGVEHLLSDAPGSR